MHEGKYIKNNKKIAIKMVETNKEKENKMLKAELEIF